ncbi:MAG: adenylate kinase [Tepidiformaceae bacterium]
MAKRTEIALGPRIAIYGPAGSGKSTLACLLGEKLGLPVVELDAIFHAHPNWVDLETGEFRARVAAVLLEHSEGWVIDGNYSVVRDLILGQADTAIWLRLPFRTVYRRLASRTISRAMVGAELWNGNRESLRQTFLSTNSMLWWGITSWRPASRKTREALTTVPHHARVIVLRSPRQVARLVSLAARGDGGE